MRAGVWDKHRKAVINVVVHAFSMEEALAKVRVLMGEPITWNALEHKWNRWRGGTGATLYNALGSKCPKPKVVLTAPLPSLPMPSTFQIPKEARPPEISNEYLFTRQGKIPQRIISDGDNHYPIHDPYMEAAKIAFMRDVKPQVWVNLGDQYDVHHLSTHAHEASRMLDPGAILQGELDSSKAYWKAVCGVVNEAHFILGNHENRLSRLINANVGLFGLKALAWNSIADLPTKVKVHGYGTRVKIGNLNWEHGDRIGNTSFGVKFACNWVLSNRGDRCTVFGHSHKQACEYKTVWDCEQRAHTYAAYNQGHGMNPKEAWSWKPEPPWTQGFTYVEMFGGGEFTLYQISVINGKFSFGGKVYDGHKCM